MSSDGGAVNGFLQIFDITTKADLVAHLKGLTIQSNDLCNLILASKLGVAPIGHIPVHRHYHPEHLTLSDENLKALAANGVGPMKPPAVAAMNKVMATFQERRLFNAHFFWPLESIGEWHLFYFDQRDVQGGHWVEGPHIHLMNMLTHPRLDPRGLLESLFDGKRPPKLSGEHVRYNRGMPD